MIEGYTERYHFQCRPGDPQPDPRVGSWLDACKKWAAEEGVEFFWNTEGHYPHHRYVFYAKDQPMTDEVRITSATGGMKGSKLARYDLISPTALHQLAEHLGRGAAKYEDRNWERGYDWSLSFAALNRHLWAFWNGEDVDEETESHHLAAVAFHAFALLTFVETHPEFDTRPGRHKDASLHASTADEVLNRIAENAAAWRHHKATGYSEPLDRENLPA